MMKPESLQSARKDGVKPSSGAVPRHDAQDLDDILGTLIATGREQGYLLLEQLQTFLPEGGVDAAEPEQLVQLLEEAGIQVCEEAPLQARRPEGRVQPTPDTSGIRDPMRAYRQSISSVPLLAREDEVALFTRIEVGMSDTLLLLAEYPGAMELLLKQFDEVVEKQGDPGKLLAGRFYPPTPEDISGDAAADSSAKDTEDARDERQFGPVGMEEAGRHFAELQGLLKRFQTAARRAGRQSTRAKNALKALGERVTAYRLTAPALETLTRFVDEEMRQLCAWEAVIAGLCLDRAGMSKTHFLASFTGNEADPDWVDREIRAGRTWSRALKRHRPVIRRTAGLIAGMTGAGTLSVRELHDLHRQLLASVRNTQEYKQKVIQANLRLVIAIARKHANRGLPLIDLVQEGNIGLMKAVDKFEYRRGFKFSTYATRWILQAVMRSTFESVGTIRVPTHVMETVNKVNRQTSKLMQEFGRQPTMEEVIARTGLSRDKVMKALELSRSSISLETPIGEDEDATLWEVVPDANAECPLGGASNLHLKEVAKGLLDRLTEREARVLCMRFGIGINRDYTLEEIGSHLSITRERVRQIETQALAKLRCGEPRFAEMFRAADD